MPNSIDLALLKPGTRIIVYMHHDFRHGDDRFWDVLVEHKVERVIAGHSHRNKEESRRGIRRLTTQNLCGPYRLITVGEKDHAIVNRCFVGHAAGHQHSYAGKCNMSADFRPVASRRGPPVAVVDRSVKSAQVVDGFQARELEIFAEVDPGTARKVGLRLGRGESATAFAITDRDEFQMDGILSPAVRGRGAVPYRIWLVAAEGQLRVQVNNRVQYERELSLKEPVALELFAEDGSAVFKKVELWELKGDK